MIALISTDPTFGNCVGIYKAISKNNEVKAFFRYKDRKGVYMHIPCRTGFPKKYKFRKYSRYIIVSSSMLEYLNQNDPDLFIKRRRGKITVILTDSHYRMYHERINPILEGLKVFCMPDQSIFCNVPYKYFYHPYEHEGLIKKNKQLTISHSPFSSNKLSQKGTHDIMCAVHNIQNDHDIHFDLIMKNFWTTAIQRRSRSHIFIDKILPDQPDGYDGGLGKSGVEAMAAGCLTLTSGKFTDAEIPAPPVITVTPDDFEEKLRYYIIHDAERQEMAARQKEWVETYLNYEYQSKYLLC